ncbi:uncharacterized protein IWZ02DRAFT_429267 [Phyllosticta citriasiana]|uniref:uncharacterized protein n=1 Tax=Phyllosticta citriasiana TaxID=595635 RepID=UPI0030FDA8DA
MAAGRGFCLLCRVLFMATRRCSKPKPRLGPGPGPDLEVGRAGMLPVADISAVRSLALTSCMAADGMQSRRSNEQPSFIDGLGAPAAGREDAPVRIVFDFDAKCEFPVTRLPTCSPYSHPWYLR